MLPSRGLPPRQLVSLSSRQSSVLRSGTSRKFSSVPRQIAFSAPSSRTTTLRSTKWRAGANSTPNVILSSSAVRHGSWYAPWTWGRSNTPSDAAHSSPSELAPESMPAAEPVVTTATPELQPAGIDDAAATVNASHQIDGKSIENLLEVGPAASVDTTSIIDPTVPISYWGNLKDLGLDYGWGPSAFFESLLEMVYINTELGWAGAIVTSGLLLRTGLFLTLQRWGSDAMVTSIAMKPLLQPIQDEMEEAKRQGDEERAQVLRIKQQTMMKQVGTEVWKTIGTGVAQAVIGYGAFRSLRGISTLPAPEMTTGGWAWFMDLTASDPYYILPVLTGGVMYLTISRGGETGLQTQTAMTSMQQQLQIVFPMIITIVSAIQPAALQLYFFVTGITGAVTGYALRQPAVRRALRIRPIPTKQSQELFSRVAKGEIELSSIKGADGKIRYQAPGTSTRATVSTHKTTLASGINLKQGATVPPHMQGEKPMVEAKKNVVDEYKPKALVQKLGGLIDKRDPEVKKKQEKKEKRKQALEKYEEERKKRLRQAMK